MCNIVQCIGIFAALHSVVHVYGLNADKNHIYPMLNEFGTPISLPNTFDRTGPLLSPPSSSAARSSSAPTHKSTYRVGFVVVDMTDELTYQFTQSIHKSLKANGIEENSIFAIESPSLFTVPLIAKTMADRHAVDIIMPLARLCDQTIVVQAVIQSLTQVQLGSRVPIVPAFLTCDTTSGDSFNQLPSVWAEKVLATLRVLYPA